MSRRTLRSFVGTGLALLLAVAVLLTAERDPRPAPAGELGTVLVRGRAALIEETGRERSSLDGSFTLYVLRDGEPGVLRRVAGPGGRRTVHVTAGHWETPVAADAWLYLRELVLGGNPTLLEPPDDSQPFPVPETRRIDLVGRARHARHLRVVDGETGRELSDVRVLDRARIFREPDTLRASLSIPRDDGTSLRFGVDELDEFSRGVEGIPAGPGELAGTWLRGASPILVPVEPDRCFRSLGVHVPGYALSFPDLDHLSSEELLVPLRRSGSVRIRVAECLETDRILRVARPDSEPLEWWMRAPLPVARALHERDDRYAWHELDRGMAMEVVRDARGVLTIALHGIPATRWTATLARADGKDWLPPELDSVLQQLEFTVTAGETTEVELAGCDDD